MGDPLHDFYSVEQAAELGHRNVQFVAIHPADTDAGREQVECVARALTPYFTEYERNELGLFWRDLYTDAARAAIDALREE